MHGHQPDYMFFLYVINLFVSIRPNMADTKLECSSAFSRGISISFIQIIKQTRSFSLYI